MAPRDVRRHRWLALLLAVVTAGCAAPQEGTQEPGGEAGAPDVGTDVVVRQEGGGVVYWVLPGERRLSERVFGTPQAPTRTAELETALADDQATRELLEQAPFLVGIPVEARQTGEDGSRFTTTRMPTPVSDEARVVEGGFHVTYSDRQPYDLPGDPFDTADAVDLAVNFTDPQGNEYEMRVERVFQYPVPWYETGGGVVTGAWLHGRTGTDSPLFPTAYAYGAFWGVGDLLVNGEVVDRDKVMHLMTTQTVRDRDYRLAVDEALPLHPDDTSGGRLHHTHAIVRPLTWTGEGLRFEPVNTSFMLPNGERQPFIHVMFEEDEIVQAPFRDWSWPAGRAGRDADAPPGDGAAAARVVEIEGHDFFFEPPALEVETGETVTVRFHNRGNVSHNFGIGDLDVRSETIPPGAAAEVTFTAQRAGTFAFWCSVPGHRSAGMEGVLRAEGSP